MSRVQYIGIPTKIYAKSYAESDACRECQKQYSNEDLYSKEFVEEQCPECTPVRRNGVIYVPVNFQQRPFIGEFYEHPDGVMAEINGRSTFVRMTLDRFIERFENYIDILEEDNRFKDYMKDNLTGTRTETHKIEKVFPNIIHAHWNIMSERERQIATVTALNAVKIIDAMRKEFKANETIKRDSSPRSESSDRSDVELPGQESSEIQKGSKGLQR